MTSQEKYDIIFSEPSNPYRAGISSLYTQEFQQAVHEKLKPGGYFSQWVQAYEVDSETLNIITATLASVFQGVEIWQTKTRDFVFVCSDKKSEMSITALKERISSEPFKTAMMISWGVYDLANTIFSMNVVSLYFTPFYEDHFVFVLWPHKKQ